MDVFTRIILRGLNKKHFMRGAICLSLVLFASFIFVTPAYAADSMLSLLWQNPTTGILSLIATVIQALAWGIGKLIILVIGMIIIPILQYNNFSSSNVVSVGWSLVRDVVNMFVIIVLLAMAIQTMLGTRGADWRQQLPRFFIAVIAVNFSKTITLFIIDISQVVMFTFVNALTDIAAGNFVNLFQISSFFELADNPGFESAVLNNGGYDAVGFLATSYLTVSLLGIVLAVLLLLALVYIYRIILLWVLLVLSPFAFFASGVGDVVPAFKSIAGQWWSKLIGAVALGPILTFFLWLALASASSGPITESEGFNTEPSSDATAAVGLYTDSFQMDKLLSIFIAIILIMVGFQAASSQASAIGGPAAQFITAGAGSQLVRRGLAYPGRAAFAGARSTARGTGRFLESSPLVSDQLRPSNLTSNLAKGVATSRIGQTWGVGRVVQKPFNTAEAAAGEFKQNLVDQARATTDSYTGAQRLGEYMKFKDDRMHEPGDAMNRAVMAQRLAVDKDEQKEFFNLLKQQNPTLVNEDGTVDASLQKEYDETLKKAIDFTESKKDSLIGDDKKRKTDFFKSKSANLHLLDKDAIEGHIADEDFKLSQLSEAAVKNPDVEKALRNKVVGQYTDKDTGEQKEIYAWDHLKQGRGGVDVKVREFANNADKGSLGQFGTKQSARDIVDGLKKGTLKPDSLQASEVQNEKSQKVVLDGLHGAANEGIDLSQINEEARKAVTEEINKTFSAGTAAQQNASRKLLFSMNNDAKSLGVNDDGSIDAGRRGLVAETIKSNPRMVAKISPEAFATDEQGNVVASPSDITNEIVKSVSTEAVAQMANEYRNANKETREQIEKSFDAIASAVKAENERSAEDPAKIASGGKGGSKMQQLDRSMKRARELMS